MSSIDRFETSPFRSPLSSGGKRSLDVMQERASALRRLADEAPDRRTSLLDVAQRLEGLANHAALAAFGQTARLSEPSDKANAAIPNTLLTTPGSAGPNGGLFAQSGRKAGSVGFDV